MTNIAKVITADGAHATVEVGRPQDCAGCPSRAGCPGCSRTTGAAVIIAANEIGARPGDTVEIYMSAGTSAALPVIAFFAPVALPLAGYLAVSPILGEPAGYVAMGLLLALSIAGAVAFDRLYLRRRGAARIVRIV